MAKWADDSVMDAALDLIATCTNITVCSGQPANYAGISAVTLATTTMTAGDGAGDWVVADGDAGGRKVSITIQSDMSITSSGDATHIAYDTGTTLLFVSTCTTQTLTSGGTVTVPAYDVTEIDDPA